jgi:hypothetical protein
LRQRSNRFQGESADKDKCESPAWKLVMNARDFINLLVAGAEKLDWVEICGPARQRAFGGRLIIIRCLAYDYEQARSTCYGMWRDSNKNMADKIFNLRHIKKTLFDIGIIFVNGIFWASLLFYAELATFGKKINSYLNRPFSSIAIAFEKK